MKIVSIGTVPLMKEGLLPGFKDCGFETSSFPFYNWGIKSSKEAYIDLEKEFMSRDFDFIILEGYADKVMYNLKALCKKTKRKFIYWAIEDPIGFDSTIKIAQQADFVFTTAIECIEKYKRYGIDAHLLTFACNPNYHKTGKFNKEYDFDLALAASYYSWSCRQRGYDIILNAAKESGYSFKLWGSFWNSPLASSYSKDCNYGGILSNNELPDLCASSKIILGVQCDDSSITQTAMRPYEILGCGGFHLTQWTKATASIFEDGKHLITAKTKEEALSKIKYYIEHPIERLKIAKAGQDYVYKYHTYKLRVLKDILPIIL